MKRRIRRTASPHATPVDIEISADGQRWTTYIKRAHCIGVNSHILRAYAPGVPPRLRP